MCHKQFFRVISENRDYVEKFAVIWEIGPQGTVKNHMLGTRSFL